MFLNLHMIKAIILKFIVNTKMVIEYTIMVLVPR